MVALVVAIGAVVVFESIIEEKKRKKIEDKFIFCYRYVSINLYFIKFLYYSEIVLL